MPRAQSCAAAAAASRAHKALFKVLALISVVAVMPPAPVAASDAITLRIVGGLGGVAQYTKFEEPFWRNEITRLSGGRISATIQSFDRSGLRGQDMLQLMRLGVVPFGTAVIGVVSGDEPALHAIDLPGQSPDFEALKRTTALLRPEVEARLRERYDIELLGLYTYPAQVIFCKQSFQTLRDLAGRRVRTSSVSQSELIAGLGAIPVMTSFAEIMPSMKRGVMDCAITGTLSGYEIGLPELTTHVHTMAISWGLSVFGANGDVWRALPDDARKVIQAGVTALEQRIWEAADKDTILGLACNVGSPDCPREKRYAMTLVPTTEEDDALRQRLLKTIVLQGWYERCGEDCETFLHGLYRASGEPEKAEFRQIPLPSAN